MNGQPVYVHDHFDILVGSIINRMLFSYRFDEVNKTKSSLLLCVCIPEERWRILQPETRNGQDSGKGVDALRDYSAVHYGNDSIFEVSNFI